MKYESSGKMVKNSAEFTTDKYLKDIHLKANITQNLCVKIVYHDLLTRKLHNLALFFRPTQKRKLQKSLIFRALRCQKLTFGGMDGTRTRDPLRDRQVF